MPAKGCVVIRPRDAAEQKAMGDAASLLGEETCDIYLNDAAYWKNVPRPVWDYTLGGYQVLKKWLSYRESVLLGRAMIPDEVAFVRDVIRRIAALLLLGQELDANDAAVKADLYAWSTDGTAPETRIADPPRSHFDDTTSQTPCLFAIVPKRSSFRLETGFRPIGGE